jgi:glucose/arabinose dehydrogenase
MSRARRLDTRVFESLEQRRLLSVVPSGFSDQAYGASIGSGTAMAFAPDGRLFVTLQNGTVRVISAAGTLLPTPAISIPTVTFSERGLLGIAFDPDFATNNYVYLYYTVRPAGVTDNNYSGATNNRLARFTVSGDTIVASSQTNLVTFDTVNAGNHNGGAINFGPDGKLYVAIGENNDPSFAQSLSNRLGKILRYNPDGSIPADNPTTIAGLGTPTGDNASIWAAGLRNPYTFTFDPALGTMYINDVGQGSWEEVNVGQPGRNFGWSQTEGAFNPSSFPNYTNPLYSYAHGPGDTLGFAITGGAVYRSVAPGAFPASYQGKYFFGDFINDWINVIDPAAPPSTSSATVFATGANGIVDIDVGPDGALYYLQRGSTAGVRRIVAPADTIAPQNTSAIFSRDRVSPTAPPHEVVYSFDEPVTATASALTLENLSTGQTIPSANIAVSVDSVTNRLRFSFPGFANGVLPTGQYRATLVGAQTTDPAGNTLASDAVINFRFIAGDADDNGRVEFNDLLILAKNYQQTDRSFALGNYNYSTDGLVDFNDLLILAQNYGQNVLTTATPEKPAAPRKRVAPDVLA